MILAGVPLLFFKTRGLCVCLHYSFRHLSWKSALKTLMNPSPFLSFVQSPPPSSNVDLFTWFRMGWWRKRLVYNLGLTNVTFSFRVFMHACKGEKRKNTRKETMKRNEKETKRKSKAVTKSNKKEQLYRKETKRKRKENRGWESKTKWKKNRKHWSPGEGGYRAPFIYTIYEAMNHLFFYFSLKAPETIFGEFCFLFEKGIESNRLFSYTGIFCSW